MSNLLTAMQSGSQAKLGSQQYPECPSSDWSSNANSITSSMSNNGQMASVCVCLFAHTCHTTAGVLRERGHIQTLNSQYTLFNNVVGSLLITPNHWKNSLLVV